MPGGTSASRPHALIGPDGDHIFQNIYGSVGCGRTARMSSWGGRVIGPRDGHGMPQSMGTLQGLRLPCSSSVALLCARIQHPAANCLGGKHRL